eukprot:CAMPEP_0172569912 /NCGR_PEP_ID=MMETSP1067-20121228/125504_1 /TAXON_ID=265564 ORGANISM="Thalassiosira punctigera, Strain Tpunct2005C2" /NCGR_SAMPLE_ID=MMETSP1067 /ASSEMBLY_ACC=CAM_ASM_000444 /LENGTH=414 /DNA_ID=CAMNT_0013361865 /DNA_START=224 /DNA_END=1468 /DNA_ORIENTATION=+
MLPERLCSGLETVGMKQAHCTLKFQPHWTFSPEVLALHPARVVVPFDGQPHKTVQFRGCKVIRLHVGGFLEEERGRIMPPTLTIGGPCYYNEEDKKNFKIMMRTRQQSLLMRLVPNGELDWPDYRAFETCPRCCVRAKPGSDCRYWLLFQPLVQNSDSWQGMGIRMVCRLFCADCFESMTDENHVEAIVQGEKSFRDVPLLDVVESQGPITWLRDGSMSANSFYDGVCMNAYTLYSAWEQSGTWQALLDNFIDEYQKMTQKSEQLAGCVKFLGESNRPSASTFWEMDQIPTKEGRRCDGPNCPNVHGNRMAPVPGKKKGKKIRLNQCTGCFETMYCSEMCQHAAWPDHKEQCKKAQRKRKEEEEKTKELQRLENEAKMEAAFASFVPDSIAPQGGGARKKKGKKGGGKKKKGKK